MGRVDRSEKLLKPTDGQYSSLPWEKSDKPEKAFKRFVDCVWEQIDAANPNPKLEKIFDYYLRMVWQLALAVPLPYVAGHLFDMPATGWAQTYQLSNKPKGSARPVDSKKSIRDGIIRPSGICGSLRSTD